MEDPIVAVETVFTVQEIAQAKKLHRTKVSELFRDEPGVIRIGRSAARRRRAHYTLRIPASVAQRVFARLTVNA